MNGSTKQVARGAQEPASWVRRAAAQPTEPGGWRLGPVGLKGACVVCSKTRLPAVFCKDRERVSGRDPSVGAAGRELPGLGEAVVCKECCIGMLGGHRCRWWDLCWNI